MQNPARRLGRLSRTIPTQPDCPTQMILRPQLQDHSRLYGIRQVLAIKNGGDAWRLR